MRDSVMIRIDAPPATVWELVSDVTQVGRFSPETFEAEWLGGATEPAEGARFRGHVKRNGRGPVYWTTCVVTACVPDSEFAFRVKGPGGRTVNTWRYDLQPDGDGTELTESFELAQSPLLHLYWTLAGWARGRTNRRGMRATLERIKAVAESPG